MQEKDGSIMEQIQPGEHLFMEKPNAQDLPEE